MTNMEVPEGWSKCYLEQIALIEMGQSPDSRFYNLDGVGLPFFQGKAEFGARHPVIKKWCSEPTKIAEAGDILLSIRAPVGPTNIAQHRSCIGRGISAIRAEAGGNQFYLFYFFRHIEPWLSQQGTGSTFSSINAQVIKSIEVPLAPSSEQDRIVLKLEELFSDLDAGVAELKLAQKKVAHYRQSLLKAAVEGKLTSEWREKNKPKESGAQLLERVLKERRAHWAAKQLAKYKEQGKTPPKGWRDKYPEPVPPDTAKLPELPEGWVWASLDQLAVMVRNGLSQKPHPEEVGYRILRINAVRPMSVDFDQVRYLSVTDEEAAGYLIETGDLLATRYNGSVDLLGVFGLVRSVASPTLHPDKLIRIKLALRSILPEWVEACAAVGESRKHVVSRVKTTAGQTGISGEDVKKMPIPLPSLLEQQTGIKDLDTALTEVARQTVAVEGALARCIAQRKNILKAAFSGQLVPQDPNDEPASVLLERIRAERAEREATKKPRKVVAAPRRKKTC